MAADDRQPDALARSARAYLDGEEIGIVRGAVELAMHATAAPCADSTYAHIVGGLVEIARRMGIATVSAELRSRGLYQLEARVRGFAAARERAVLDAQLEPGDQNSPEGIGAKGVPGGWTGGEIDEP